MPRDYRRDLTFEELLADDDKVRALLDAKALEAAGQAGTIASLRTQLQQAEDEAGTAAYVLGEAEHRNAKLATQLQQAEARLGDALTVLGFLVKQVDEVQRTSVIRESDIYAHAQALASSNADNEKETI